jgi:hypothetical protein
MEELGLSGGIDALAERSGVSRFGLQLDGFSGLPPNQREVASLTEAFEPKTSNRLLVDGHEAWRTARKADASSVLTAGRTSAIQSSRNLCGLQPDETIEDVEAESVQPAAQVMEPGEDGPSVVSREEINGHMLQQARS